MKPAAMGRILFWRGGSLWIGLAGEPAGPHRHHAVQVSLAFPGGRLRIQDSAGSWNEYSSALVVSDYPHAFEARGQRIAQIFVDPESRDGQLLQQRYRDVGIAALPEGDLAQLIAGLADGYETRVSDATLIERARAAIVALSGTSAESAQILDERISRALVLIREGLGNRISLASVAEAVHLSPERFRHLFIAGTGVGFRPYVLWLRLECALVAYVAGQSLTDAAYIGGFSDSAHFSRTFKSMFGITPASVRPE